MRASLLLIAFAACTPEIYYDTYSCGPNQACPEGQACNGSDDICVMPGAEKAFACSTGTAHEPDDTPAQAFALPALDCVSAPYVADGCLAAADTQDWYKFHTPTGCTAVEVDARMTFPIAQESVSFELWDFGSMTMLATDGKCMIIAPAGDQASCIKFTVNTDADYGIVVKPKGGGDCGGRCNFNRYQLTVQLATPS
jgi:hypothetical protein